MPSLPAIARSQPRSGTPQILAVHCANIEFFGFLGLMRMLSAGIDAQVSQLNAAERPARQHPFNGLFDNAFGKTAVHDGFRRPILDATDETGVMVINLVFALASGQHSLGRIDDDDRSEERRVGKE